MDVSDTNISSQYYDGSSKICVSCDCRYYNEKLQLQAKEEEFERIMQQQQQEEEEEGEEGELALHSQTGLKKMLLIDDEHDTCMTFQTILQDTSYECISYTASAKALQEFRSNYYDLILLDIKMPVLNGFELCKRIREVDKKVHIIFITASEEYYEKFRSQHFPELGTISYIQKPIGNQELVQIVNMRIETTTTVDKPKLKVVIYNNHHQTDMIDMEIKRI
jgi:CheY-like chemotaxis protein